MGKKEIAVKKVGTLNLRIAAAKATLRKVRQQGHVYVELRPVTEKRSIFFCTLCLTQCFSESVLYDHLQGNLHGKRYEAAKITLLLPNPWPFNDGVLFFNNSREKDLSFSLVSGRGRSGVSVVKDGKCGANGHGDEVTSQYRDTADQVFSELTPGLNRNGKDACNTEKANLHDANNGYSSIRNTVKFVNRHNKVRKYKGVLEYLTIPQVLLNEELSDVELKIIGFGQISAKICEDSEGNSKFSRIWCAWHGDWSPDVCDELSASQKCDFAIVNFSYTYGLGRKGAMDDDENRPPASASFFEMDESGRPTKMRKKSFSDPEDSFRVSTEQYGSSCEHSHNVDCCSPCSSYSKPSRRMSSRVLRKELRKHNRSTAERNCDICRHPMLPGKDVATLLSLKTRKLACSSRNTNGAFHLFHVSCLIHWVLLSEFELWNKWTTNVRGNRGRKGKASLKNHHISSIFCPECQGTGAHIEDNALEKPFVPLSETFIYKLNAIKAHKSWMKSPEDLKKCSTGLCFPTGSTEKLQGKAMPAKLLLFYRAGE